MSMSRPERLAASKRWHIASGILALLGVVGAFVLRPIVLDPMPSTWLNLSSSSTLIRRDSFWFFLYPLLGVFFYALGLVVSRLWGEKNPLLRPLPARLSFLLTLMCLNIGVMGWVRPDQFTAWLVIVYVLLGGGLVFNHIRSSAREPVEPGSSTAEEGSDAGAHIHNEGKI